MALDPDNATWQRELAVHRVGIGAVLSAQGNGGEAIREFRDALAMLVELTDEEGGNLRGQRDVAKCRLRLAQALAGAGALDESARQAASAMEIGERLLTRDTDDRYALLVRGQSSEILGRIWEKRGDPQKAHAVWTEGLESIARAAADSADRRYLTPWAAVLIHLGRLDEARPIVRRLQDMGYHDDGLARLCESKGLNIAAG